MITEEVQFPALRTLTPIFGATIADPTKRAASDWSIIFRNWNGYHWIVHSHDVGKFLWLKSYGKILISKYYLGITSGILNLEAFVVNLLR